MADDYVKASAAANRSDSLSSALSLIAVKTASDVWPACLTKLRSRSRACKKSTAYFAESDRSFRVIVTDAGMLHG